MTPEQEHAVEMELLLQASGMGQGWVAMERVLVDAHPQPEANYRVGMQVGRVDLFLGVVSRN